MKRNLIRLAVPVLLATQGALHAAVNNPGLFSTGIDNQGHLITAGSVDPHYTLIQNPDPNFPGPSAFITTATPGPWLPNGPNSQWIAPSPNQVTDPCCAAAATYIYRTSFDLTGIDPSTVVITGEWTSDNNTVDILINGQSTGLTTPFDGFGTLSHPFTISTGFVSGVNTLDFVVFNGGSGTSSTGLRVEFPLAVCPVNSPCITSPSDGASPQSQFAAISGTGTPGDTLDVLVGGFSVGQVQVDSEGNWEALPYASLYGSSVTMQVQDQNSSNLSNTITVHPSLAAFLPGPSNPPNSLTALLPLRKADIFVLASDTSPQYVLYGPNYTHAALYLGGDSNGTPLIAEAVTAAEAGSLIGTAGQVRSIPLDQSLAWTQSQRISAWHPRTALPGATRSAIVTWAQSITSQGLPYWSYSDFGLIGAADVLYLSLLPPRLNSFLNAIYALTTSTNTFICSTLVWRAYYEGTGHTLDISQPNLMSAQPGSLLGTFGSGFIGLLSQAPAGCTGCAGSVLIVPETFVRSPLLSQIF